MHLVFLNQYYPPDAAPTGVMLQAVAEECARQGHRVTVICADGGYADGEKRKYQSRDENAAGQNIEPSTPSGYAGSRHRTSDIEHRSEENCSGVSATAGDCSSTPPNQKSTIRNHQSSISHSSTDSRPPTTDHSSIRILRLPATRFGRGTFVGKLLDYASYYLGVTWKLMVMQPPPDRIVALTTPPYLSVLARAISKVRGADHAHWVMDLYPDVMVAHGMLAEGGWKHRLLAGLARWGFNGPRCAAILTLGPDMAERCDRVVGDPLSERSLPGAQARPTTDNRQPTTLSWVPLWGATGEEEELSVVRDPLSEKSLPGAQARPTTDNGQQTTTLLRAKRGWADDELIVMYSGNMGLGHRFGEVLEVVRREEEELSVVRDPLSVVREEKELSVVRDPLSVVREEEELSVVRDPLSEKILPGAQARPTTDNRQQTTLQKQRFVFYGGGKRRGEIEAFMAAHPEAPVELHDYAPAEELAAHLQSADVHLVSLNAEWTGTMVPSKLQGIFAAARPVIFIGSEASSIAGWVRESGGGWVVRPDDVADLRAALDEARDPSVRALRGQAALAYASLHFDKSTNVKRVAALFGNLTPDT